MSHRYYTLFITGLLVFLLSCKKESKNNTTPPPNAAESNIAIGVKKDASLNTVFQTLNNLHFDIRQMNGFGYNSTTTAAGVTSLINLFNQKQYVNTGAWKATPYTIYFFAPENLTRVVNTYFNMNGVNQADLLHTIDSLGLVDRQGETKNMYLSVPEGTESYWKTQLLGYPFVKWTETFDQECLSFEHASITSADVPPTGAVNQVIPIPLRFVVINGCGSFGNFSITQEGSTKTITVNAKYEGCVCTQEIRSIETTYNFTATTTGQHNIRFVQPDGTLLTHTILIQ